MADDVSTLNQYVRVGWEWAAYYMREWTGITPTLTSAARTLAEQENLFKNKASNPYPVNKPGDSAHQVLRSALGDGALGFDSWVPDKTVTVEGEKYNSWYVWTYIREAIGFRCPANDRVHAEIPNWRDYRPTFR